MQGRIGLRAAMTAASILIVAFAVVLVSCAPEPSPAKPGAAVTSSTSPRATSTSTPTPSPSTTAIAMPTDCRAILSSGVLAQLKDVPLNDPAFGKSGVVDGGLVCIWGSPKADTTNLTTKITRVARGAALDMLNGLVAQGFTCYTPDQGTRCEKTWPDPHYPVTDGRTLFWRDGILIDTTFSNLAPTGYTGSIVAHVFA
ncbi:hypothetical protein [Microbacterium candidum]|uniref:DUF3558 domain-containing protein n=1 Tax=Microbacterium candidum TaxID=3041922 RepID=A0ABT7MXJ9_9MICO|nr:hypothetical protein [Microbacterium sp. ASV49]MDL9979155.1 hypothetical protein [Microbacterium sp. ASV49]